MSNVHHPTHYDRCRSVPDLERVCYHMGQLLGPQELTDEHDFFAHKLSLIVSRLLGHGVVCGLEVDVDVAGPDSCAPPDQDPLQRAVLTIQPGLAVDSDGQLLVVRERIEVAVWAMLGTVDRERATAADEAGHRAPLFVSLRFGERGVGCARPLATDACAPLGRHQPSRARECVTVEVTLHPPHHSACDGCCDGVCDQRELLAVVHQRRVESGDLALWVDEAVRRPFGTARLTTIRGISWVHNGIYGPDDADNLLTGGFGLRFSAPVQAAALTDPRIVEVGVHSGGSGPNDTFSPRTVLVGPGQVDHDGLTQEMWINVDGDERLSNRDTVRIAIHCDFVLDRCCRAVDGEHVGGRVPLWRPDTPPYDGWVFIEPHALPERDSACESPPSRRGLWESGNGSPGGTFRSWIRVAPKPEGARG